MAITNGFRFRVSHDEVFEGDVYALVGSVVEEKDFQKKGQPPAVDKVTGKRVYKVKVYDTDPETKGQREINVRILADHQPVLPASTNGTPFVKIEFEGLMISPWGEVIEINEKPVAKVNYSYRATGFKESRKAQTASAAAPASKSA